MTRPDRPVSLVEGRSVEDGGPLRLEAGRPALVNVWGSWCGPCRLEQPVINRAFTSHPDVRFLGLDVQDNDAAGQAFRREFKVEYPSISDPSRELASRLGAVSTPASFAIDAQGVVRGQIQGSMSPEVVDCMLALASGRP